MQFENRAQGALLQPTGYLQFPEKVFMFFGFSERKLALPETLIEDHTGFRLSGPHRRLFVTAAEMTSPYLRTPSDQFAISNEFMNSNVSL